MQHPVARGGRGEFGIGQDQADHAAVGDRDGLGAAGRTGGERHVGAVGGGAGAGRVGAGRRAAGGPVEGADLDRRAQAAHPAGAARQSDGDPQSRVLGHGPQAGRRKVLVERYVRAACLEDAHQRHQRLQRAAAAHADQVTGPCSGGGQARRQGVGVGIELRVGHGALTVPGRRGVRPGRRLRLEQLLDTAVPGVAGRGRAGGRLGRGLEQRAYRSVDVGHQVPLASRLSYGAATRGRAAQAVAPLPSAAAPSAKSAAKAAKSALRQRSGRIRKTTSSLSWSAVAAR